MKRTSLLFLSLLVLLVSMACGLVLPAAIPTATLPSPVESHLKSEIVGQWKVINGGPWGGAILSFSEDGIFSMTGGLQEPDAKGTYYFSSEDTIAFQLPDYQGTMTLSLASDMSSLTVSTSKDPFGIIYSIERVR